MDNHEEAPGRDDKGLGGRRAATGYERRGRKKPYLGRRPSTDRARAMIGAGRHFTSEEGGASGCP